MRRSLRLSPTKTMSTATEQSLSLHDWSAASLADAYRCRALSPVEVVKSVLRHIEQWEPHIHASYLLRPERAIESARASELRWMQQNPLSAIDGVPVTLKDNIAIIEIYCQGVNMRFHHILKEMGAKRWFGRCSHLLSG